MIQIHSAAFRSMTLGLLFSTSAISQPFTNLNFEAGIIRVNAGGRDTTEVLIPGWTLTFNGEVVSTLLAGLGAAGNPTAWLADSRNIASSVIQGRFSLVMEPGFTSPSEPREFAHWGLYQIGRIPAGSQALRFQGKGGEFDVRIDGVSLDLVDESPTDLWFAADVGQFAGQSVYLGFYTTKGSPETGGGWTHTLDTIEFSPNQVIPEPSAIGMVACGVGVLFLLHRDRARRTRVISSHGPESACPSPT